MTKVNRTLLIICLVLVFSISITFTFISLNYSVNAEGLTNNAILDFNQLLDISRNFKIVSTTTNRTQHYASSLINFDNSHKYFIGNNSDSDSVFLTIVRYNNGSYISYSDFSSDSIYYNNNNYNQVTFQINTQGIVNGNYNFMIVDLTQCFGVGNEPSSVEEFKSYFSNDYYPYTLSTLISLNTLDAYTNGVNDTLSNLSYSFTAVDSYNRITNANVKINNITYDSTLNKTTLGNDFVSLGVPGSTQNGVLYFPFSTTLNSGDTISLSGYYGYLIFGSGNYSVDIVVVNGDSFAKIDTSTKTGSTINELKYINNLNYTLPFSCSGIYFICQGAGVCVSNFTISVQVLNFQSLINDAYKSGQKSVDIKSIEAEAYEKGKQFGISLKGENVWSNANEFIKNIFVGIFDILSIEFLPNVTLGTFVLIPLIFSVLFFIVKVSKGGGD